MIGEILRSVRRWRKISFIQRRKSWSPHTISASGLLSKMIIEIISSPNKNKQGAVFDSALFS
jgi:hypothetical protein